MIQYFVLYKVCSNGCLLHPIKGTLRDALNYVCRTNFFGSEIYVLTREQVKNIFFPSLTSDEITEYWKENYRYEDRGIYLILPLDFKKHLK